MKFVLQGILLLYTLNCYSQWTQNPIIEYNNVQYRLYEDQDTSYENTPLKFYYKYDSLGTYLGNSQIFPHDGKWISFFSHDKNAVASIFHVKESKLEGPSINFRIDGTKICEVELSKNELNGFWKSWYNNGQMSSSSQYRIIDYGSHFGSIRIGLWESWHENGQLKRSEKYQNNSKVGESVEYYTNGQLKNIGNYTDGYLDGKLIEYHSNGELFKKRLYSNGVIIDKNPVKSFHPNGNTAENGNLNNGMKKGHWVFFDTYGNKISEGEFAIVTRDHEHGDFNISVKSNIWKYYYPNQTLKARGSFDINKESNHYFVDSYMSYRDENWEYYSESGKIISREDFENVIESLQLKIEYDD